MKQQFPFFKLFNLFCLLLLQSSFLFAQNPMAIVKTALNTIAESPRIQNLKKNKGLHSFEKPSEGYQSAMINGRFGYISLDYDWAIPPQYDYSFPFREGLGIVFLEGQPFYIDKSGNIPFKTNFAKHLSPFQNGRAFFKTPSGKMGMLNKHGQLLGDTVFQNITPFDEEQNGFIPIPIQAKSRPVTVAMSLVKNAMTLSIMTNGQPIKQKEKIRVYDYALIDTLGQFVVPFGKFKNISPFVNGFTTATNDSLTVLFNTKGQEVWRLQKNATTQFHTTNPIIVKQNIFKVIFDNNNDFIYNKHNQEAQKPISKTYNALLNIKNEWVLKDTAIGFISDFDDKKAVAYSDSAEAFHFYFYSKKNTIEVLPKLSTFPNLDNLKKYGADAASSEQFEKEKWGIMDSCLTWIVPPQYDKVSLQKERGFPYFILTKNASKEAIKTKNIKPIPETLQGIADGSGHILFEAENFIDISPEDSLFRKFYFTTADDLLQGIMDRNGKVLSQHNTQSRITTSSDKPNPNHKPSPVQRLYREEWKVIVNTDCDTKNEASPCNIYQKTTAQKTKGQKAQIIFLENDSFLSPQRHQRTVIKAQLMNPTTDTIFFKTNQNRLNLTIQAQDTKGQWRDISFVRGLTPYEKQMKKPNEYLGLPPQYFWSFELPTYNSGCIKTKCRCLISTEKEGDTPIISEEWTANINPSQLWMPPFYTPERYFQSNGVILSE